MVRVIAKNWQGIIMKEKLCKTKLEARDFINKECLVYWDVTSEKVGL